MSDKRGNWTKNDLKIIWKSYVENKILRLFSNLDEYDLTQMAPCSYCRKVMLRAQYQGVQPNKDCSWDVDHIDSNPKNNILENLQPMHPWCNKEKN